MPDQSAVHEDTAAKTNSKLSENVFPPHTDPSDFSPGPAPVDFASRRENNARLCFFWNRCIRLLLSQSPDTQAVWALFDKDGCMLELYGQPAAVQKLAEYGIYADSVWTMDTVGQNAVTDGLNGQASKTSCGNENQSSCLKHCSLFFSPIILKREAPPFDVMNLGGTALILPKAAAHSDYQMLAGSIAHDLILNLQFSQISNMVYERISEGVLTVDTKIHKIPTITHCSSSLYDILGIPQDVLLDFHPITELIDPLPANPELWDILQHQKRVNKKRIRLQAQGRSTFCIISTDAYAQEKLNTSGINFFITTDKRITAQVSSKIGNNALLSFDDIIGESPQIQSAIRKAHMLADTQSNILLQGESGVGKDVFAQAIHNASDRQGRPFIAVNCGALPRELIASELFGYDSGAFTGAKRQGNIGKFELASGGTIFLNEIGELPLDLQAVLLRVVEQKRLMRLGSSKEIDVDVKIISATNADISKMIREKNFRADLYYRLSTMQLFIPPLRNRGRDIILLSEYFIRRISKRIGRIPPAYLSEQAQQQLLSLPWHGNVRELQNVMERIVQLYPETEIQPEYIMDSVSFAYDTAAGDPLQQAYPAPAAGTARSELLTIEDIRKALEACRGNRTEAAKMLGIARRTLYRNMERLGIAEKKFH